MPFEYKVFPAIEFGLSPCPYCGNKDVILVHDEIIWYVWCNVFECKRENINCWATKEEAIEDWEKEAKRSAV